MGAGGNFCAGADLKAVGTGRGSAAYEPTRTAQVVTTGHAGMQNLQRRHYELGMDAPPANGVAVAVSELARAI